MTCYDVILTSHHHVSEIDGKGADIFICVLLSRFQVFTLHHSVFVTVNLTQSLEYHSVVVFQEEFLYINEMCDIQKCYGGCDNFLQLISH
jgi:hypothetical protein